MMWVKSLAGISISLTDILSFCTDVCIQNLGNMQASEDKFNDNRNMVSD